MYVVPHCHWDAEWYFTCEDSHILLVENMDYLLDLLEKDADFPSYTFDGLAIVLDDYLKERPENTSRIHALIRQRRLFVGPWYTQCDSLLIRTESLIRNLQYGIRTATQFGHSMNVGYLPDIFGQHAWLPAFFYGRRYRFLRSAKRDLYGSASWRSQFLLAGTKSEIHRHQLSLLWLWTR
ncbi:hypothetical protein QBS70_03665 [Cronobacter sakazakii]|nr:hypothetical protein [Cronobacter sakazakii]